MKIIESYNLRMRTFPNGIRWFRIGSRGPGLWWWDRRYPTRLSTLAPAPRFWIGRYLVKLLWFDRD